MVGPTLKTVEVIMRITVCLKAIAVAAALAMCVSPSFAQHAGFRVGIQQPAYGFPPIQAPALAVRGGTFAGTGGFITAPVPGFVVPSQMFVVPGQQLVFPGQQFLIPGQQFAAPGQVFVPNQIIVPNAPIHVPNPVIVPNQLLVPGQTIVAPPAFQAPAFVPPTVAVPVIPVVQPPVAYFGPPVRLAPPLIGTPRHQVLTDYGQPTVSVITSRGEVLQFRGGVTVVIHNGQVISSR